MIKRYEHGAYLLNGTELIEDVGQVNEQLSSKLGYCPTKEEAIQQTMAYNILKAHNTSNNMEQLKITFDCLTSHDITFVGIIQTARASGLEGFPVPYVLTNCHNSLCAVGGTINEDDHMFGLSCAKKYGGVYVPPHQAVIHQYAREMLAGCGKMILGSDSHTRYGALGTMAIGEGGPELVKQLLKKTYDIQRPEVVAVYLTGKLEKGVGPQDIALAIIGEVFADGYVKNKVMEFVGDGIDNLSVDYRIGIDVMTTETTCLSSIWRTDSKVKDFFAIHGRVGEYKEIKPGDVAYYDGVVYVDLSKIKPMIAMPFHPSNTYTIEEVNNNLEDILAEVEKKAAISLDNKIPFQLRDKIRNGKLYVEQGVIAGCAGGGFENLCDAADILSGQSIGSDEFSLSVYPASQPIFMELVKNGAVAKFMEAGATVRTAFCGPCFGAGDVPANNGLSIRHSTRNFPNREGSKITSNQIASVALMDARSIAATAANKGYLIPATEVDVNFTKPKYFFDKNIYENRVYNGVGNPKPEEEIKFGPNIVDWPEMVELTEDILLRVVSVIHDPVTTTDELIPSGETSSYRSNPLALAEYTLSRKDPKYVERAKEVFAQEKIRRMNVCPMKENKAIGDAFRTLKKYNPQLRARSVAIGTTIYAVKPGDGSAREQAASCQRVLGGMANIAKEYATKRYRSNLINWGMIPFLLEKEKLPFENLDFIYIPNIKTAIKEKKNKVTAYIVKDTLEPFELSIGEMTDDERDIILAGSLINYYAKTKEVTE